MSKSKTCCNCGMLKEQILEDAIDSMGWEEINAFHEEISKGQSVREDGGGYWLRCIKRLFGLPSKGTIETYQFAVRKMLPNPSGNDRCK
jgi:hypothetical protein